MQGYTNLANIAVINPLSTMDTTKNSHPLYNGYPNPKKARLIQHVVFSKTAAANGSDLPGIDIDASNIGPMNNNNAPNKIQSHTPSEHNPYSTLMANNATTCFYSPGFLEPYVINTENLTQSAAQTFDITRIPVSNKTYCSFPNPSSALSSIFLTGGGIEWSGTPLSTSNPFQSISSATTDNMKSNSINYQSSYGDCNDITNSLLNNLKSRDVFQVQQDYNNRYSDNPSSYLKYDQSPVGWYKLKEETRPNCSVPTALTTDQLTNGYDYNYREMKEKRKCDVCGDVSAGFHCSAFVCEACKKFFIRSSKGDSYTKYSCTKNNNCEIVKDTRTHCQYCRFQKCLQLGMTLPGANLNQNTDISLIPCRVCGAQSSGFHFGAITCEGCKGFFRRTINERENQKYTCRNGGNCVINLATRNNCKSCRYKKCLAMGMSKEGSRIGRQPNAIKHMCAKEISQIRAGLALNHFSNSNSHSIGHTDSGMIQAYLPNHLSSAIMSTMNLDFNLANNQTRYQQTTAPLPTSDFYLNSNSSKYPLYNLQTQPENENMCDIKTRIEDHNNAAYLERSQSKLMLQQYEDKIPSNVNNSKVEPTYYDTTYNYNDKDIINRNDHTIDINSCSGSLTISEEKTDFRSSFTESNSREKSDDHCSDSGFMKEVDRNFNLEVPFISSIDQMNIVESKFSVDMPLHKFISTVNLAAKALCNCRRRVTRQINLLANTNETYVWDVMMQHFQAHAIQVIKFAKAVPGFKELFHNDMKVLVQEGMYPIILVQLSRDFNLATEEFNYFNFSNKEKEIILTRFAIFNKIADHVMKSGRLIKLKNLDDTIFSLICYVELVKGESCSIFDRNKVNQMYQYSINALKLYMTEIGSTQNEIDSVLEIFPVLSKMTHEHQEAVMMLRTSKPHLKFPNLYTQMFLVD